MSRAPESGGAGCPVRDGVGFRERPEWGVTGKVLVDITNPVDWPSFDRLVTPADSSAAEEITQRAPGARVVKAFNTTFASTVLAGTVAGQQVDVLLAGDDEDAKSHGSTIKVITP